MATVNLTHSVPAFAPQTPFVNEPFVDFTQPENKRRMQAALADVETNSAANTTSSSAANG